MGLAIEAKPIPLVATPDGVVRVGGTRVTLDSVVAAFDGGATPEEIAQQYPTLSLADIYTVVAFYLQHEDEVGAYLREREQVRASVRQQNASKWDPQGVRERLLARRVASS